MRLVIPVPGVIGEVLCHGFVGIQPDLSETQPGGFGLSQGEQARASTAALHGRPHRQVLQEQVIQLRYEYHEADDLFLIDGYPRSPVADGRSVVSRHGSGLAADSRNVALVSLAGNGAQGWRFA